MWCWRHVFTTVRYNPKCLEKGRKRDSHYDPIYGTPIFDQTKISFDAVASCLLLYAAISFEILKSL